MQSTAHQISDRKLPVKIDQVVKSYTQYALPLCAICADNNLYPWVLEKFIQIKSFSKPSVSGNHMNYCLEDGVNYSVAGVDYSAVLDVEPVDSSKITDLISFVEGCLTNGFYLHASMDEYYLPAKFSYQKEHYIHPSLIYGFNAQTRSLNCAGFVTLFDAFDIGYEDFVNSINKAVIADREKSPLSHKQMDIFMYKPKKIPQGYSFPMWKFINIIHDYLNKKHEGDWVYGMNAYNVVDEFLEHPYHEHKYAKYNTIHFLSEHKHVFRSALQYMAETHSLAGVLGDSINKYSEVVKLFDRVKFVFMDLAAKEKTWPFLVGRDSAGEIKKHLRDAIAVEKRVLEEVLGLLRRIAVA